MTHPSTLHAALGALLPPPCEFPARCEHWRLCSEGAACPAFTRYTQSRHRQVVREPSELPSERRYLSTFPGQDECEGGRGTETPQICGV